MKAMNLKFVKFASYVVLIVGLSTVAFASCGDTLAAMATGAAHPFNRARYKREMSCKEAAALSPRPSLACGTFSLRRYANHPGSLPTVECWRDGDSQSKCRSADRQRLLGGVEERWTRELQARSSRVDLRRKRKLRGNH